MIDTWRHILQYKNLSYVKRITEFCENWSFLKIGLFLKILLKNWRIPKTKKPKNQFYYQFRPTSCSAGGKSRTGSRDIQGGKWSRRGCDLRLALPRAHKWWLTYQYFSITIDQVTLCGGIDKKKSSVNINKFRSAGLTSDATRRNIGFGSGYGFTRSSYQALKIISFCIPLLKFIRIF